jgi:hypothetical protein
MINDHQALRVAHAAQRGVAVGDHDIYVTSFANTYDTTHPPPPTELDTTQYGFFLVLKAAGTTPTGTVGSNQELYRKVGTFRWDGSAISQGPQRRGSMPLMSSRRQRCA